MVPDVVVDVLTPVDGQGVDSMAENGVIVPGSLAQQNMTRIGSAGASAHEHFVTFAKILDLAYEADRKMVSLVESLGVREATSKSGQRGIPASAEKDD